MEELNTSKLTSQTKVVGKTNAILDVPYLSQYEDVVDPYWQDRTCTIICLAMAAEYFAVPVTSIDLLIEEGLRIGGFTHEVGWKHDAIVSLFHNHGIPAYREEFRSLDVDVRNGLITEGSHASALLEEGVAKIVSWIEEEKPVIVSALKRFSEAEKLHSVLIIGYKTDEDGISGFYYHDPDSKQEGGGKNRFVEIETFRRVWRRLAIFPYKQKSFVR